MDQVQNADPNVTQDLISRLTKEVTDLRNENARLQSQLGSASADQEDEGDGAPKSYDDLLEEIADLKAELKGRPTQEEFDELEEKIQKHKHRKREWRESTEYLSARLYEAESARDKEEGFKEDLEWEIEKLRKDLIKKTQEKEEALARLESQRLDNFDIRGFLHGRLGELPPRPNPVVMTLEEENRIKSRRDKYIFPATEAGVIKWAKKGGRFVVSLPSVVYNGKTQLTEPFRANIVTDFSYEVFGEDKHNVYYGTYRCAKRVTMDWDVLVSFGREFVASFLDRVTVQKDFAAPALISLIQHMYKTGLLKVECFTFQYEGSS